ncbi:MAG: adenylyl-sulfate kinase, partial [Sulfurovaceae bacterium]|nr:adenylyl-sulfate kinase [Sulfurovaceae bacterium]
PVLKIILYWGHERIWHKIRWEKKKIEPFNLWFSRLLLSGKTTITNKVYEELKKIQIPIERLDSKDIRNVQHAEIIINRDELSVDEAVITILNFIKKEYIK